MSIEKKDVIKAINEILEQTWTNYEVEAGKHVDVTMSWVPFLQELIFTYRKAGWVVSRNVELSSAFPRARREYLLFKWPHIDF